VFVASTAGLSSSPVTFPSASEIEPDGTATRTTSASEASPPVRPSSVTVSGSFPPPTEAAADISPADGSDVHRSFLRFERFVVAVQLRRARHGRRRG
jgi:hypothetical protein